jgi:copper chaperone CopZ
MKWLFLFITTGFSFVTYAQVTKVSLQASGLTCSMCSNSVYKSLKTIGFIDKIDANIKTSTFEITFRPADHIDFDILKVKVEDAGYAVAKFVATIQCRDVKVEGNEPVRIGNVMLQFVNLKEKSLNGEKKVRIVSKGFIPSREYKKNLFMTAAKPGVYYAVI